ncbi:MAG TPA: hypothetical protein VMT17_00930 [Anaeromyxobacteraceae bacterium]|nr:hypothetical protein [Anaeromyxobacteraceae bacterium]
MSERSGPTLVALAAAAAACGGGGSSGTAGVSITFGSATPFATHVASFAPAGFTWGPPDGTLGAVANGDGTYTFFGAALGAASASAAGPACSGSPGVQGAYRFTGTLEEYGGLPAGGCRAVLAKGGAPSGWVFDADYAGGGSVLPFKSGATDALLMTYHGEVHWKNPNGTPPTYFCNDVPCFYGGIGLAVSVDGGATFKSMGQIIQPYQPLSYYQGTSDNVGIGYGALVLADGSGDFIESPPAPPSSAYLYVFYEDYLTPGAPGAPSASACVNAACVTVARARWDDVVAAVLPLATSSPTAVSGLFRKFDGSRGTWTQPAASGDPTLDTASGVPTPLFPDANSYLPSVIWDTAAKSYLMVHQRYVGQAQPTQPTVFVFRSSTDLVHWSDPLATFSPAAGHEPFYPTLVGETGNPLVGGGTPRLFFDTYPAGFPNWGTSELDSLPVQVTAR